MLARNVWSSLHNLGHVLTGPVPNVAHRLEEITKPTQAVERFSFKHYRGSAMLSVPEQDCMYLYPIMADVYLEGRPLRRSAAAAATTVPQHLRAKRVHCREMCVEQRRVSVAAAAYTTIKPLLDEPCRPSSGAGTEAAPGDDH